MKEKRPYSAPTAEPLVVQAEGSILDASPTNEDMVAKGIAGGWLIDD